MALFTRVLLNYAAVVGNHAITQRFTYTVPIGKRATLTQAMVHFLEVNVSPASNSLAVIRINGNDWIIVYSINAISERGVTLGGYVELQAGDVVAGFTANNVAANNVFQLSASIVEYQ